MELKSPYTYRPSFNRYSSHSNIKRGLHQLESVFAKKKSDKSYSKSRVDRSLTGLSPSYMEHLITIRKNLQRADHIVKEPMTSHIHMNEHINTHDQPSKATWLQKRSFFERNGRESAHINRPHLSSHKELINWVKLEIQFIVGEYKLDGVNLGRLQGIITFKPLLQYLLELMRKLAKRQTNEPQMSSSQSSHQLCSNFEDNEVNSLKESNLILKRSEAWAKLKFEEIKVDWKESVDKVKRLQNQLESKQSELYQLSRLCLDKDKAITSLQRQIQNINGNLSPEQTRIQEINAELEQLRMQNSRLNEEMYNNNLAMSKLERIITEKDQQFDKISTDKSRLMQLYASLEKEKIQSSRIYEQELLTTIKKLCEERRILPLMKGSRSQLLLQMLSPSQNQQTTQGRKQILDLIVHSLQTLQRRENEYRNERKEIAKSREKLYKQSVRISQQINIVSKQTKQANNASKIQYNTSSSMPPPSNTSYGIHIFKPSEQHSK